MGLVWYDLIVANSILIDPSEHTMFGRAKVGRANLEMEDYIWNAFGKRGITHFWEIIKTFISKKKIGKWKKANK